MGEHREPCTDIGAVLTTLASLPIQIVGLNCSTGPDYMREPVRYLSERSRLPISTIPNAGLPLNTPQGAVFHLVFRRVPPPCGAAPDAPDQPPAGYR